MTNGANYKRGKLHHSPWHSDIRTSNQLNMQSDMIGLLNVTADHTQRLPYAEVGILTIRLQTQEGFPPILP